MRSEVFGGRCGPGLSADWQKWHVAIMDQLGLVGTAIMERLALPVISSILVLPRGIRLAHSVLTSSAA
jgi:hypothetical protein